MTRSHDGEVPVIDRCDFGQPEALGDGNNRASTMPDAGSLSLEKLIN
jgi:hypothetical protein